MKRIAGALCLCVLLAGCSCREVNDHLAFPFERQDNAGDVAAKSAGNAVVMPFVAAAAAAIGAVVVGAAALAGSAGDGNRISGSIGRDGVRIGP